ncbi:serine/threonine-protein kinase [Streptomyces sp. NPDC093225]|uniref:serine/threonine-protein kinase n=1 Tax=Streptomyces sp. NPDC093225 TaxID=3366034 RepID=UPI00381FA2C6
MEHRTGAGSVLAGRYRLGEPIGSGGMGKVWRAHDELLHRTVAVKELTAGLYVAEADRAVLVERTRKEARAAARIQHPAVVTVHDVLEHDDRPWIVMEYVDGPSLADAAKAAGRIEPREAARIGLHVLGALRAAHAVGVLHRDVKPGNVLLAKDGRVLLTDFGIAAIEGDSSITRTGELVGSIDYLAPERVTGGAPDPASDLWALGATLYTAVEARSPFRRTSPISSLAAVVNDELPPPRQAGALGPVITALLHKDPAKRPSAAEAERMLLEAMEGREPRAAHAYVPTQRITGPAPTDLAPQTPHGPTGHTSHPGHPGHQGPGGHPGHAGATGPAGTAPLPEQHQFVRSDAGPAGPDPRGRAERRRDGDGGRTRRVAIVALVAALLGGGLAFGALKYVNTQDDDPTGSGGTTGGPVTRSTKDTLPAGWVRVTDPAGFTLAVPKGWKRRTDGDQIDYTPDEGKHRIRISRDTTPDFENPYMHLLDVEKSVRSRLPKYHRETLHANTYRGQTQAGVWEFTWTEKKDHPGAKRAIDQMYVTPGGTEYAIYMSSPAKDWDTTREQFDVVLSHWQPAP